MVILTRLSDRRRNSGIALAAGRQTAGQDSQKKIRAASEILPRDLWLQDYSST